MNYQYMAEFTTNVIKWLDVQEQDDWPVIWAIVDDTGYEIVARGTGWEFPDDLIKRDYLGTVQDGAGAIWHYFMK